MLPPIDLVAPFNVLVAYWIRCPCAALHLRSCPHSLRAHTSLSPVVRPAASFIPCEIRFYKMTIFQPNWHVAIFTWLGLAERSIKFHKNHPLRDLFSTSITIGNWESMESRHRLPICTSNFTIRVTIHVLISYIFFLHTMRYPWGLDTDCMTNGFERPDLDFLANVWLIGKAWYPSHSSS